MKKHDFRNEARAAADRARQLIGDTADLPTLRYAALELRLAMEALTYDRAQAFERDLPRSEYGTWQPKKLLGVLLDLDPRADTDVTVAIGRQPAKGVPADYEDMVTLGSETVLNMRVLKDHYDAIGNRLHMPSLKQIEENGDHDPARLRARLERALAYVEKVLASRIFNVAMMGLNSQIDCERCGYRMRKAVRPGAGEMKFRCPECGAPYILVPTDAEHFNWVSDKARIACAQAGCEGEMFVFTDEVVVGAVFECPECQRGTRVAVVGVPD